MTSHCARVDVRADRLRPRCPEPADGREAGEADRAQVYLLAGFGYAGAHVVNDSLGYTTSANDYSYFGGQGGLGIEFRLARHFALNLDALGFIRTRTDSGADQNPEFIDPSTGQTSNTSAGVLFRGGMTFYF